MLRPATRLALSPGSPAVPKGRRTCGGRCRAIGVSLRAIVPRAPVHPPCVSGGSGTPTITLSALRPRAVRLVVPPQAVLSGCQALHLAELVENGLRELKALG